VGEGKAWLNCASATSTLRTIQKKRSRAYARELGIDLVQNLIELQFIHDLQTSTLNSFAVLIGF